MKYTGERYIPEKSSFSIMALEHWHRYLWAKDFAKNKVVLDIACGEGYGSNLLADKAHKVYSCDVSEETVKWAKQKYARDNIKFEVIGLENLHFEKKFFDLITCFETIEHVDNITQKKAINTFGAILKDDGVLLISTPSTDSTMHCGHNDYHVSEFSFQNFYDELKSCFKYVKIIGQSVYCSSVIGDGDGEVLNFSKDEKYNNEPQREKYLIAICSNTVLNQKLNSVMIDRSLSSFEQFAHIKNCIAKILPVYNLIIKIIYSITPYRPWREKIKKMIW